MLSENDGDSVDSVMVGCDNLELKIDLDRNFACHSTVAMLNLAVLLLPMILVGGRQRTHRNEGQQVQAQVVCPSAVETYVLNVSNGHDMHDVRHHGIER